MRTAMIVVLGLLVFNPFGAVAETGKVEKVVNVATQANDNVDITTKSGDTYTNCKIERTDPNGITFFHAKGITTVPFIDLPDELQEKYNYNPTNAAAYTRAVNQKQAEAVKRQKIKAMIKEEEFVGEPRQTFYVMNIGVLNKQNQFIGQTEGLSVSQDTNSAVYKIVLKNGGGVDMVEIYYESAYRGGAGTMSMAAMHSAMQSSINAPKVKRSKRDIFLVGLPKKLAEGEEWKGKIYECGLFEIYTGSPPMRMYATTKELAIAILNAQIK